MTNLTYNLSRDQAAKILGISTRTLDRYIRKGLLSYKKIGNRVYLNQEEVIKFKESKNFQKEIQQVYESQIISGSSTNIVEKSKFDQIENIIQQNFDKFLKALEEKDKIIEEKNKIIFSLQHRLGELENKLQGMIALPDYTREKEKILLEKEKLELQNQELVDELKKTKIWNLILFFGIVLLILVLVFLVK